MKQFVGALFQFIGIIAGIILVLAPFGKAPMTVDAIIWFAFPCGCVAGHLLLISGTDLGRVRMVSMMTGGSLLLLALCATVAQFMVSAGMLATVADSFSLWYVVSGGFVLGGMGWSMRNFGRAAPAEAPKA